MPNNVISNSISFLKTRQGGSAFVVDLDDEMTSIVVDENGNTTGDVELSPLVSAFYGTSNVIGECTVTVVSTDPDVNATYNANTHCVDIAILEDTYLSDVTTVTITVVHASYGTRTITFTIVAVPKGEGAFIQELLPSINEVSFARTSSGSLTPPSRDLSLLIKKTEGGTTSNQSISASGLTIRWSTSSMPSTSSGGTAWGSGTATGITWSSGTMVVANNVDSSNIYIAAFNNSDTLVDRETIPVIKDGKNGDKGDLISFTNTLTSITIECDSNGLSLAASTKAGLIALYVNGSQLPPITLTTVSKPTSLTVTTSGSGIPTGGFSVSWSSGVNMANLQGTIVLRASSTGYRADISIPVMCTKNGERGKTGRFYYFADTFNEDNNTDTYSATDSEAPFFFYNNNYWVWKGDNFANKTMKWLYDNKGGYPSSSNNNYDIMTSDFKYLITEAIFGPYAHFGSAIINGDWLLSKHGTINGGASTNYQAFDPSHPNDNTGSNFIPNYCVDLLLGKSYQNDAVIRGTIMADNLYHGVCFMSVQGSNNGIFFCNTEVRNGEEEIIRPSFYTENEGWSDSSWYIDHLFEEGKYYTADEIRSISNNEINEGNDGFTECSGYCDTVYVLPTVNNSYPTVFLPRPEDVQGKCVDVFAFQYGTGSPATFYVSCCNLKGMTSLIYYDEEWKAEQSTPTSITCETNVCMRFMSTKVVETSDSVSTDVWYWLAAPYFK